ncbi:hypothetical protein XELAEV_18025825mg [Xenopus laevis]|uniref:Secreted protein n=1 Tax=Xenopus laevis TaxID=8355 RepID=A0A974D1G6_XENLA|nr:hypothetical protein XELAEV_18025825mg [Xenopus laevis]
MLSLSLFVMHLGTAISSLGLSTCPCLSEAHVTYLAHSCNITPLKYTAHRSKTYNLCVTGSIAGMVIGINENGPMTSEQLRGQGLLNAQSVAV